MKSKIYNSVEDIDPEVWQQLKCTNNTYFSPDFLWAFESSNHNIDFKYVLILEKEKPVGLAIIETIELSIDVILKNIKISNSLKRILNFFLLKSSIRILFCGNIFLSGEHGVFICGTKKANSVLSELASTIKNLSKQLKPLHAIFIKDFTNESLKITNNLKEYGYASMQVEPNLIVQLNSNWTSFEDYKQDLKSKYRVKVNRADAMSASLTARLFSESDFATYKYELQKLYENTIANANFNAQVLNLDTYVKLRSIYHEDFIVKAYFLEGKLVGFLSALVNNNHLDAHFIGLNYELNKEYGLYPRILNDYVRIGIEKRVSHINLGRTASEIKTTIGATPIDLTCYIRHRRPLMNSILQPFIKNVKIKDFKEHYPFKTKKET